jgi:hypothetical protein
MVELALEVRRCPVLAEVRHEAQSEVAASAGFDTAEAQEAGRRIVREKARALYRLESASTFRLPG